jgi:RNA polymerase sigma-70 factor (ECF subfamily)
MEAVERLLMALRRFPPQMRRCFLLRFDQGLKYREIAAVMHLSIETVKSQLGQARQRLRSEVGDAMVEGREVRP